MFKKINEVRKNKKESKKKTTIKVYKRPIFLIVGLISLIAITIAIYMIFLNFKEIMRIEYDGYAISGKKITENLLGNSSEENKNLNLIPVKEQDELYKKLNSYFIGENKQDEINLEYPIYINNNSAIYNLSQNTMLITSSFEEVAGYPNLTATNGAIYNQNDLERIDNIEYVFLKNENNVYTSLKEMRIITVANEYKIPLNSSIYFDKEAIRYYEVKNNKLIFKEIGDIDNNSKVQIGDKEVSYQELLTKFGVIKEEKQNDDIEEIRKEDTSKENQTKNEEVKKQENEQTNKEQEKEEVVEGKYIKPEVSCSAFIANVYTMNTNLTIKDPSRVIQGAITFEIKKDGKVYVRKTYTSSGNIQITGLEPNTNYEIEGTYIYLDEQGRKVENTFYRDSVTTKGLQELKPITLSFENGEIFANKIQISKLRVSSDLTEEAVKGIKRAELTIGNASYEIKSEKIKQILSGQEIVYETSEGLKSNNKIFYEIKFYDKQGNEMKLENNKGESKTAKQKPSVSIRIAKQNIIDVTLGIKLNNKDKVEIQNYRYVITKPNGDVIKEGGLKENDSEIFLNDLDPNQYYSIKVYGNYDLNDEKRIQENQVIGETVFATQPLSTLGYVNLSVEQQEVTTNSGKITVKIDEEKTDKRLIQILKELKVQVINKGKDNQNSEQLEENTVISETIIEGEQLQDLKQGGTKEETYEDLKSNTKYEIKIIAKVSLGETIEEIQTTYELKEFITMKKTAEVQMKNLFVTEDMIDFDVRIEDQDNASLMKKVRMELRDEKQNLIKIEYISTNEEYMRKTFEKLELNKTYMLSFYADQYNEGSTDSTYKPNYLLKQLDIYTETGITGSIGLTDLTRKAIGKNLVDMSSEIKWYVYPNFNTSAYYGKEYDEETKILKLEGRGNLRRAVYDLQEYAGQTVTMSFRAKLIEEGEFGTSSVMIQNKKTDGNWSEIKGLSTEKWQEYSYTMQLDSSGFLGFYIQGGNGIEIKELQIELGERKTTYEEYRYMLEGKFNLNLIDQKQEISTKDYYVKIYEENNLIKEEKYDFSEMGVTNEKKNYIIQENHEYRMELAIKIRDRYYILDKQNFNTNKNKEIKGIQSKEDFLEIQPNGKYIVLNDIDLSQETYQFGGAYIKFEGEIDFNGYTLKRDAKANYAIFNWIGSNGIIENVVLDIALNNIIESSFTGLVYRNEGVIRNIIINLNSCTALPNKDVRLVGYENKGTFENFIINFQEALHGARNITGGFEYCRGTIKNGYIYGKNINSLYNIGKGNQKDIGVLLINLSTNGELKNVYSLTNVDYIEEAEIGKRTANICVNVERLASVRNIYSVGIGKIFDYTNGPNIYSSNSKILNSYYFSDTIFANTNNIKTTELALYDIKFQNQLLNDENQFEVEKVIKEGFYPQLKLSEVMPLQEYISLPEIKDEDLPDILSTEVIEQGTNRIKVRFSVNNPSGETINKIKIKNIDCNILTQNYADGKSEVIAQLENPILCVSQYSIISIETQGVYGLAYDRKFKENERIVVADLYREIHSIADWKLINKSPTENYIVMQDLDFINENSKDFVITAHYTGKMEGNDHTIKNVIISPTQTSGLFRSLNGTISNLNIDTYKWESTSSSEIGLISFADRDSVIENVHIKNEELSGNQTQLYIGGLIGRAGAANIRDSSVTNLTIIAKNKRYGNTYVGGLVGGIISVGGCNIHHSFVQDLDTDVKDTNGEGGIGGIVGGNEYFNNQGKIQYCYAIGNIQSDVYKLGGIIGDGSDIQTKNNYSFVNIKGESSCFIGGIVGAKGYGVNYPEYNLAIGNISGGEGAQIGRISGNNCENENINYASKGQLLNGYVLTDRKGAILLSEKELVEKQTYYTKLNLEDNFSYEKLQQGILPKLYNADRTLILKNQLDHKIPVDLLGIEEIECQKENMQRVAIQIVLNNPQNVVIQNIEIEGMDIQSVQNLNENGKTYVSFIATPVRYFDSYTVSQLNYIDSQDQMKQLKINGKIDIQFYKEIYTFEDWQAIDPNVPENYKLMADIDFQNREDANVNVSIARLEAEAPGHTLRNITITDNKEGIGLISKVTKAIKNVTFENFNITNGKSYTGVIAVSSKATLENLKFKNIIVDSKGSYVGCIASNTNSVINQIELNHVKCYGISYVAGLVPNIYVSDTFSNIVADEMEIIATGDNIGGICSVVSNPGGGGYQSFISNISIKNAIIEGRDIVGGVIGNGTGSNLTSMYNTVTGEKYVGGIVGSSSGWSNYDYTVENVKVYGNKDYIGGVAGLVICMINRIKVVDSIVQSKENNSNSVGGIAGETSNPANIGNIIDGMIENCTIQSNGNCVGALVGKQNGRIQNVYAIGCTVEGYDYVGGIAGRKGNGEIKNTYNNSQVIAISHNAGGIVGYLDNTAMSSVNNTSSLINNYVAKATVNGKSCVGGIIGNIAENLYTVKDYYYNNYVEAVLTCQDDLVSLGIGGKEDQNPNIKNSYYYQYSTINGKNPNLESEPYILENQYLKEIDLKDKNTYQNKLKWGTSYTYDILAQNKYPILKGVENQEGIDLPKDSEHIVNEEAGISTLSLESEALEELQESFEYNDKKIETYETYSVITNTDGEVVRREERLYVKDGKLYGIDGRLDMVINNLIVDSYNEKEYETILGTDGKLYDLKDQIHYPENFVNEGIQSIGNNLHREEKEITVTYENGSKVMFNYQTGEVIEEQKVENNTSLLDYLKEQVKTGSNLIEDTKTSYEENKTLISKLQLMPIEKAMELKNKESINNTVEEQTEHTTGSSDKASSITSENRGSYITMYNSSKKKFEVYKEEEILDVKNEEVISQNERIEKNNLNEYYVQEARTEENGQGLVWISLSITGIVIILFLLIKKNVWRKK